MLVMDLAEGDLFSVIRDRAHPSAAVKKDLLCGIIAGLNEIHDRDLIHQDVKGKSYTNRVEKWRRPSPSAGLVEWEGQGWKMPFKSRARPEH